MPEIYTVDHPYFHPEIPGKQSASAIHQIIFGEGVDHTFPHQVVIPMRHESKWNYMDSSFSNDRKKDFLKDFIKLGEVLRKFMVGDIFLTSRTVGYSFNARDDKGWRELHYDKYYEKDENGKLIRLPVECNIKFITIQFREEVDKTQFILLNDGEFPLMDELDSDYRIKTDSRSSWLNEQKGKSIRCPMCRVHYDESNNNKEETIET